MNAFFRKAVGITEVFKSFIVTRQSTIRFLASDFFATGVDRFRVALDGDDVVREGVSRKTGYRYHLE